MTDVTPNRAHDMDSPALPDSLAKMRFVERSWNTPYQGLLPKPRLEDLDVRTLRQLEDDLLKDMHEAATQLRDVQNELCRRASA